MVVAVIDRVIIMTVIPVIIVMIQITPSIIRPPKATGHRK
jgi:hypothetical protein